MSLSAVHVGISGCNRLRSVLIRIKHIISTVVYTEVGKAVLGKVGAPSAAFFSVAQVEAPLVFEF